MSEGGHWGDGHQSSKAAVQAISQHTTLDTAFEQSAFDLESRDIARCRDIANGFTGADDENGHHGQDHGAINRQVEGLDPNEGHGWCIGDAGVIEIPGRSSHNATGQQTKNDTGGFHDRRSKSFAENDGEEDEETETDVFGTSPWESMRSRNVGAKSEKAIFGKLRAETTATCPVLEAGLDEMDTNEDDSWACDDGWEDPLQRLWR